MLVNVTMNMEIPEEKDFEEIKRIFENHIDYAIDIDSFPEIQSIYNVHVNKEEK